MRRNLNGFALGVIDYNAEQGWLSSNTSSTTTGGSKPSITDTISKWLGISQQAAQTYQTIKTGTSGSGSSVLPPPPPPPAPDNTGMYIKIGLGVVGAGILTAAVVAATKKSSRKK